MASGTPVRRLWVRLVSRGGVCGSAGTSSGPELDHEGSLRGARPEDAVIQDQIDARPRRESGELFQEFARLEQ